MWNNSTFPADISSAVSISLPDSVVILTTISSVLSVIGAIIIFLSYLVVREARNSTRLLLVNVTVADLITCIGTLVGSIRYFLRNEEDYIIKEKTSAINCTGTDSVCLVQSFVNTFSAMASFFWTAIIMLHILMTLHKMEQWTNHWKMVVFNIISWGIPLSITIIAAMEGALGEDFSISTGPWCWIKGCLSPTTVIMWMSVTGKFWEVLTYVVSMLFYLGSKYLIWRRTRTQMHTFSFGENSNYNLRDEDQLYTMIFLVLVPLRIFGTIRFFIAVHKSISNDNLVIFNHIDHVLLYFQSVGDSGQAFCNAILFCLKDRVVRRGLLERLKTFCGRPKYVGITFLALSYDVLGEDFFTSTGPWCWIKGCLLTPDVYLWMTLTGKGWEILTYILTMTFYIIMKIYMWKKRLRFRDRSHNHLREEDELYIMIFFVIIILRAAGTIRFFYAIGENIHSTPDTVDIVLLHIQSFGDSAQAFANCILFCIRDTAVRQDMWNRIRGMCRPVRDEDPLLANRVN